MNCQYANPDGAGGFHCGSGGQHAGKNVSAGVCRHCLTQNPLNLTVTISGFTGDCDKWNGVYLLTLTGVLSWTNGKIVLEFSRNTSIWNIILPAVAVFSSKTNRDDFYTATECKGCDCSNVSCLVSP